MSTKKDKFSKKDILYMRIALVMAKSKHGLTGTNPSVGCVIVKNEKIISVGSTSLNGRPHAEYNAIKNSIEDLSGSKMYVTLEPCCHKGLTPPCTKLIINSNISEVFYSIADVDKRVKNKSFKILKSNKIKVKKGLLKEEIKKFYIPYFFNRKNRLPFVTGKVAISRNNLIYSKLKKKITDKYSDKFTHFLRYKNDSLMISYKTLNKDNPRLDCRIKGLNKYSPIRIILDNKLNSNMNSFVIKTANKNNTLIFYNEARQSKIIQFEKKNIRLIRSKILKDKKFDFDVVLKKLYKIGCRNLLIEGGDNLTNYLIKKRVFNKFYLYKSPKEISKRGQYLEFKSFKYLNRKYKSKVKLNLNTGKDNITIYS